MTKRALIAAAIAASLLLSACGSGPDNNTGSNTGGGGGNGGGNGNTNTAPIADAGSDHAATQGDTVTLDGSNSSDNESAITYQWTQTTGPTVTLLNDTTEIASFVAPNVTEATTLDFTLTVTDTGGLSADDTVTITVAPPNIPDPIVTRDRYSFNNQCFAIQSNSNGKYLAPAGNSFTASADSATTAEAFYFKPAELGSYMLYDRAGQLLDTASGVAKVGITAATDSSVFSVITNGDTTTYPPAPVAFQEPTPAELATYRSFVDPEIKSFTFNLIANGGQRLAAASDGVLALEAAADSVTQEFLIAPLQSGCAEFPEAQSNVEGETFSGKTADGRVLGMADAHVHISATDFLGKSQWGTPFHKHGVLHALGEDCEEYHGPQGSLSVAEAAFSQDFDGHETTGWPTFPNWPARNNLFHEAIYWKWLERAWMSGLRVIVNDLVDNETLCELARNARLEPTVDCNSMNNAGRQAGTMYAMQDYIDAQMGGRGKGWYQIVHTPEEGRAVIEKGLIAVVLGIEISNFLNCKVNYGLFPQNEPNVETGDGFPVENGYTCKTTETGADDEVLTQIERIHGWGVRQVITIHEFDNAFGGNGIFGGLILNVGNREDSGGIPGGALANPTAPGSTENPLELPSGQFWTTYDCPEEGGTDYNGNPFSGYLWGSSGGDDLESLDPTCPYLGQGGRPGGLTPCYPAKDNLSPDIATKNQCNARWLTPIGLYTYRKLMEHGMIFDIDHLEMEMKTQALELAEAQPIPYPFVSTHGTFGGTSVDQAQRILANGGFLYPSLGNGSSLLNRMNETRQIHADSGTSELFGFGFGTDTNGLSGQSGTPDGITIEYPYVLFEGTTFDDLADFNGITGVTFNQPANVDANGNGRTWDINEDGSAHYGMLSGMVEELRQKGTPADLLALFNSAERYLRTWSATVASQASILANTANDPDGDGVGNAVDPGTVLRAAPTPACEIGRRIPDLTNPACITP